jgi:NADH-quinone oxidoreductase subunit N
LAFRRPQSAESAFKYLVLSGAASATFLMGVSLLYGATGSMSVDAFGPALASGDVMTRAAVVLVLLALFLKAAVVPFHAWAPDTYEGASIPVTAYMATLTKGAVLLASVRLFSGATASGPLVDLLLVLPLVSIVWGNLAAIKQQSPRRLLVLRLPWQRRGAHAGGVVLRGGVLGGESAGVRRHAAEYRRRAA